MALDTGKIRNMSPDDLAKEEEQLREQVWRLRLQMTTGQLQDPQKVRRARKDLARVLSIKREQELNAEAPKPRRRRRK
jgi:large subunit ribosomal protein L29